MSLPLIIRTTEEALKSIDDSFRHGSLSVGGYEVADHPQGRATDGVPQYYYGIDPFDRARVRRDRSYPFTVAAYFLPQLPKSIFDQCMALPYHLYVISTSGTDIEASRGWLMARHSY